MQTANYPTGYHDFLPQYYSQPPPQQPQMQQAQHYVSVPQVASGQIIPGALSSGTPSYVMDTTAMMMGGGCCPPLCNETPMTECLRKCKDMVEKLKKEVDEYTAFHQSLHDAFLEHDGEFDGEESGSRRSDRRSSVESAESNTPGGEQPSVPSLMSRPRDQPSTMGLPGQSAVNRQSRGQVFGVNNLPRRSGRSNSAPGLMTDAAQPAASVDLQTQTIPHDGSSSVYMPSSAYDRPTWYSPGYGFE
jgi:hypothetical protein